MKAKSCNRIVFFTTLSVYLGLVLAGGTAPVLAHSALTRSFDIHNEIELKDDLDNKPENEEIENLSDDIPSLFAQLFNEIKRNIEDGRIPTPISKDFHYSAHFGQYQYGYGFGSAGESNNKFDSVIVDAIYQGFQRKAIELSDYVEGYKNGEINVEAVSGNWALKISFSKSNAALFAEFLNREFSTSADAAKDKTLKQIYENTKATSENNQVFIVTRLPRASIDSLLARNAQ
jgi:hypothetical protein